VERLETGAFRCPRSEFARPANCTGSRCAGPWRSAASFP